MTKAQRDKEIARFLAVPAEVRKAQLEHAEDVQRRSSTRQPTTYAEDDKS